MTLDIVIAINNLENKIESIFNKIEEEMKNIKYNVIFIDNNSDDKSLEVLKNLQRKNDLCIKIISLSKKFDKDTCFYTGIVHSSHELVCLYDSENDDQISQINKLYDYILKHKEYDQVCLQSNTKDSNSKLKIINKIYKLNYDSSISYTRIMNKYVVNAIIEFTKHKPFSLYTFNEIGFNTYYLKTDYKINNSIDYKKLIEYSNNKNNLFNIFSLILILLTVIYLILVTLNILKINDNILLLFILLTNIFNVYLHILFNKQKVKTFYIIKEKIGFDENVL